MSAGGQPLLQQLGELRRSGQRAQALALLQAACAQRPQDATLARWAWQHQAFWWQPIEGPRVRLVRRGPQHADLLRRCWADADFMARFHRGARPLPPDTDALQALLLREHWALPEEGAALHWVIERAGAPIGLLSLVEWSLPQRRAEFLIGFPAPAAGWSALEATHLALGWLAEQAQLERLSASFYADNLVALRQAEHLGFEREGVLRGHWRDADGRRSDLHLAGLLLEPAFFARHARLRQRLLGSAACRESSGAR